MIKSMTGFGRGETITEDYKVSIEIKSVNHRYCDLNIKLPKKFNAIENNLRNIVKQYASRGKIDVYISYEDYAGKNSHVHYHSHVAQEYMAALEEASKEFSLKNEISASNLVRFPDVLSVEEESSDFEAIFPVVEDTLRKACANFVDARLAEGEQLYKDLTGKLEGLLVMVDKVEKRSPEMMKEYRQKILDKVSELLGDRKVDESILATEMIIYADKVCVDEETVRLRSHIQGMLDTLKLEESIGRKLDFIAQEMNREANTTLSKANDKELSDIAIDMKTEIEKIREQIQNIE